MGKSEALIGSLFYFEGFSLDASRRTLCRGDAVVDLRPKCFDVLTCLVRGAGRVVTKDELIEAVWPKVVVTDESLTRCVSDIRQALGDAEQHIVKTVPRRGYVLVAPVSMARRTVSRRARKSQTLNVAPSFTTARNSAFGDTANPRLTSAKFRDSGTAFVFKSQIRTLRSLLPEASQPPSGLTATQSTRLK